jgi:hypothetical protein
MTEKAEQVRVGPLVVGFARTKLHLTPPETTSAPA